MNNHTRNQARYRLGNTEPNAPRIGIGDKHDTTWMADGECIGANPDMWFPFDDRGNGNGRTHSDSAYALARTICHQCPVQEQCLDYALATRERHGMWGATTPTERSMILRQRKATG